MYAALIRLPYPFQLPELTFYLGSSSCSDRPHLSTSLHHAVAETPTVATRALLYIVRVSPSFLLHPSFKPYLPYLSSICASLFNFNLPLGFVAALLHERLFQTPSKRRSRLLHIPVAPTRECCIAGFAFKIKAMIGNQGDKISLCGFVLEPRRL